MKWKLALVVILLLLHGCAARSPVAAVPARTTVSLRVTPKAIRPGETAVLRWSVRGVSGLVYLGEDPRPAERRHREEKSLGEVESQGSLRVSPIQTTTYVLSCETSSGPLCASATLRVK